MGSDGDSEAYDFQAPRGGNDRSQRARGSHGWGGIAGSPGTLVRSQVLRVSVFCPFCSYMNRIWTRVCHSLAFPVTFSL